MAQEPGFITKAEYARARGVSPQYIGKLVARGLLPHHEGRLDRAECDAVLDSSRTPAPAGGITLLRAQTRKTVAEASLKELQLAIRRREVAPICDMVELVEREYATVRAALLALPTKVCGQIPQDQRAVVFRAVTAGVRTALENLTGRAV